MPDPSIAPPPLRTDCSDPVVSELLEDARTLRPWPEGRQAALLREIHARIEAPRSSSVGWVWAAVAAAAMAALIVGVRVRTSSSRLPASTSELAQASRDGQDEVLALGGDTRIVVAHGSRWSTRTGAEVDGERHIFLDSGSLQASVGHQVPGHPLTVTTPHLRVVVVGTRFSVDVLSAATVVTVDEGRVRLERGASVVFAGAGDRVSSADTRLAMAFPTPSRSLRSSAPSIHMAAPSSSVRCPRTDDLAQREACLTAVAKGDGLGAQNALYELGLVERDDAHDSPKAVEVWREYQQRFPQGALAPEASVGVMLELVGLERYPDAVREIEAFLRTYPHDPRSPEIALLRGNLLREQMHQLDQAEASYAQVLAGPARPELRDEAMYYEGLCQSQLGDQAAAQKTWRRYLSEFPAGAHAHDVAEAKP